MEAHQGVLVPRTIGRRPGRLAAGLVLCFGLGLCGQPLSGQVPAAPPASAAQDDPLVFSTDRMLVVIQVAETHSVDFEVTMGKVKEVLAQSERPERRRQAAHWKFLRSTTPQDGVLTYFFLLEEVARGVSYDPFKILGEALPPEEVGALFAKVGPGLRGISAAPLAPIVRMGGG